LRGHGDFVTGVIDKRDVDVFEVIARRLMNGRRGIDARRRERCEE
jgi:hypothetical protein